MRSLFYGLAFVLGFFTAQYAVTDEDRGMEVEQAFLEGVEYGAKEATLNQASCTWRKLFTDK
jgi:hypothetical protein